MDSSPDQPRQSRAIDRAIHPQGPLQSESAENDEGQADQPSPGPEPGRGKEPNQKQECTEKAQRRRRPRPEVALELRLPLHGSDACRHQREGDCGKPRETGIPLRGRHCGRRRSAGCVTDRRTWFGNLLVHSQGSRTYPDQKESNFPVSAHLARPRAPCSRMLVSIRIFTRCGASSSALGGEGPLSRLHER